MNTENLEENKNRERIIEFWKRVNSLLRERGFTQESFSVSCGFAPNRINNWTNRKTLPDALETYDIARKLGVSIDFLITGNEFNQKDGVKEEIRAFLHDLESRLD